MQGSGFRVQTMCSGSEACSYFRLIDFVYHSTLGLRVIKSAAHRVKSREWNVSKQKINLCELKLQWRRYQQPLVVHVLHLINPVVDLQVERLRKVLHLHIAFRLPLARPIRPTRPISDLKISLTAIPFG